MQIWTKVENMRGISVGGRTDFPAKSYSTTERDVHNRTRHSDLFFGVRILRFESYIMTPFLHLHSTRWKEQEQIQRLPHNCHKEENPITYHLILL